jgi:hypothetical protein
MAAETFSGDRVEIGQTQTSLRCVVKTGATSANVCDVPFDPIAHRFWRLRERAGQLFWETSPDGQPPWAVQHMQITPFSLEASFLYLGTDAENAVTNPGVARFASFNL